MQRKIEIECKQRNYIIKVDDELTLGQVLINSQIIDENELVASQLYIASKSKYVQPYNKLKDFRIVNNDKIIVMENNEKTI